jgi:hypothetical protein
MKLVEAVKFMHRPKGKKSFVNKLSNKMINDWKKIWKPGRKVGLDIEGMITYIHERNPELIQGGPEDWGKRQYKDVVKLAVGESYNFPFDDEQQTQDFNNYLKKTLQKI